MITRASSEGTGVSWDPFVGQGSKSWGWSYQMQASLDSCEHTGLTVPSGSPSGSFMGSLKLISGKFWKPKRESGPIPFSAHSG